MAARSPATRVNPPSGSPFASANRSSSPADTARLAEYEAGPYSGFAVLDRLRAEMLHRVGMADLLHPATLD